MARSSYKGNRLNYKLADTSQLIRFAMIGMVSNLAGFVVYLLLTFFLVEPKIAMTLVYMTGATVGYFGSRQVTFTHKGKTLPTLIKYSLAHALCYTLNFIILYVFVDRLLYPHQAAQFFAILVLAGPLFLIFKKFVFADKPQT